MPQAGFAPTRINLTATSRNLLITAAFIFVAGCAPSMSTPPTDPTVAPFTLDVLAYNTWMLPPVSRDNAARADAIPNFLAGYDIVVLNELFEDASQAKIARRMQAFGYHNTPVLGAGSRSDCGPSIGPIQLSVDLGMNGGVMIFGKGRLEEWNERTFGEICTGEDCCSAKGVLYARYSGAEDLCVHVFGTHLQNQSPQIGSRVDPAEVRTQQLRFIRQFIDDMTASAECEGPVVVAGDLNLQPDDLPQAAEILQAHIPEHFDGPRSWGQFNSYAQSDEPEHLDYVLVTEDWEHPLYSANETRLFKSVHTVSTSIGGVISLSGAARLADLSDHHPVAARFEWRNMTSRSRVSNDDDELSVNCDSGLSSGVAGSSSSSSRCTPGPSSRCVQVVDASSTDPTAFDDYFCY